MGCRTGYGLIFSDVDGRLRCRDGRRLSAFLGSYDMAVHFFLRLLASAHQSAAMQATFLREFLYVLQACGPTSCRVTPPPFLSWQSTLSVPHQPTARLYPCSQARRAHSALA